MKEVATNLIIMGKRQKSAIDWMEEESSTLSDKKELNSTRAILSEFTGILTKVLKNAEELTSGLLEKGVDKGWKEWNAEKVVRWILSLRNVQFLKYESRLKESLTQIDYMGEYLKEVTVEELRTFGIHEYSDAKALWDDIQNLVNPQPGESKRLRLVFFSGSSPHLRISVEQRACFIRAVSTSLSRCLELSALCFLSPLNSSSSSPLPQACSPLLNTQRQDFCERRRDG